MPFLLILLMLAIVAYLGYKNFYRSSSVHYRAFGISIPSNYSIHGIDVSRYQKSIGWNLVEEMEVNGVKIGFAFMKATEGLTKTDLHFKRNWRNAGETGVTRGAYHFFIASKSGKAQAAHFLEHVALKAGDLPPVLDVEQMNGVSVSTLQQRVAEWLQVVEKVYHVKPIIYTNANFYERNLAGRFDEYPLWVAHYLVKDKPRIKRKWHFWQHSETGRVNGINARVDFNVFNGDSTDFRELLLP
jgi:lysozyme